MTQPASEIERVELAIVEYLKAHLPNDVFVDAQPDDPQTFDIAGKGRAVLVHFARSTPGKGPAVRVAGRTGFAIICFARSLRGASSGYALVEDVETAMAGAALPGCREFSVLRSALEAQGGGLWRWVVEVETETVRGRVAPVAAAPFISGFERSPYL